MVARRGFGKLEVLAPKPTGSSKEPSARTPGTGVATAPRHQLAGNARPQPERQAQWIEDLPGVQSIASQLQKWVSAGSCYERASNFGSLSRQSPRTNVLPLPAGAGRGEGRTAPNCQCVCLKLRVHKNQAVQDPRPSGRRCQLVPLDDPHIPSLFLLSNRAPALFAKPQRLIPEYHDSPR